MSKRIWWAIGSELYFGYKEEADDVVWFNKTYLNEDVKKKPISANAQSVRNFIEFLKAGHESCKLRLTKREKESIGIVSDEPEPTFTDTIPEPPPKQQKTKKKRKR